MNRVRVGLTALISLLVAVPAFAATTATAPTFAQIVNDDIVPFVNSSIVPLLYILAFLFFLIGIVRYFFMGGAENREQGRAYVLWALIGMVAIFGVWGIVHLLLTIIPGT